MDIINVVPQTNSWISDLFMWVIEDVLFGIFQVILMPLFKGLLWWLVEILYQVLIWAPLQVINVIVQMFSIFCSGFASVIFGINFDTNSFSINGEFQFNSPFGFLVIFVFVIGLFMFFISFLWTFTTKRAIDSNGHPTTMQSARLKYLRWPLIMLALLFLGPSVMVIMDGVVEWLITRYTGPSLNVLTEKDVDAIIVYIPRDLQYIRTALATTSNIFTAYLTPLYNNLRSFGEIGSQLEILSLSLDTGTKEFQDMVNAVQPGLYNQIMKLDFRTFTNNVTNYLNAYEDIAKYLNNPTDGFSSLITQYEDAIQRATFAVGQAVPDSFASLISGFKNQLYTLQDNFWSLLNTVKPLSDLGNVGTFGGWKSLNWMHENRDLFEQLRTAEQSYVSPFNQQTTNLFANFPEAIDAMSTSETLTAQATDIYNMFSDKSATLGYCVGTQSDSLLNLVINGGGADARAGLNSVRTKFGSYTSSPIMNTLYTAITGDANGDNWSSTENNHFVDNANILQWMLAVFSVFGMVLLVYTYTQCAIKRTFYLIAYWMMGFIYLGNGISNQQSVQSWFKTFVGKWWCIIVLYIIFELVIALIPIFLPIVNNGMQKVTQFTYGGINLISSFALIFTIEAALQVGYQMWSKYEEGFGAGEENFNASKSFMLTEGKGMLETARGASDQVLGAATAPFSAVKNTIVGAVETRDWWRNTLFDKRRAEVKDSIDQVTQDYLTDAPEGMTRTRTSKLRQLFTGKRYQYEDKPPETKPKAKPTPGAFPSPPEPGKPPILKPNFKPADPQQKSQQAQPKKPKQQTPRSGVVNPPPPNVTNPPPPTPPSSNPSSAGSTSPPGSGNSSPRPQTPPPLSPRSSGQPSGSNSSLDSGSDSNNEEPQNTSGGPQRPYDTTRANSERDNYEEEDIDYVEEEDFGTGEEEEEADPGTIFSAGPGSSGSGSQQNSGRSTGGNPPPGGGGPRNPNQTVFNINDNNEEEEDDGTYDNFYGLNGDDTPPEGDDPPPGYIPPLNFPPGGSGSGSQSNSGRSNGGNPPPGGGGSQPNSGSNNGNNPPQNSARSGYSSAPGGGGSQPNSGRSNGGSPPPSGSSFWGSSSRLYSSDDEEQ